MNEERRTPEKLKKHLGISTLGRGIIAKRSTPAVTMADDGRCFILIVSSFLYQSGLRAGAREDVVL
jgi:hypothetical protein